MIYTFIGHLNSTCNLAILQFLLFCLVTSLISYSVIKNSYNSYLFIKWAVETLFSVGSLLHLSYINSKKVVEQVEGIRTL